MSNIARSQRPYGSADFIWHRRYSPIFTLHPGIYAGERGRTPGSYGSRRDTIYLVGLILGKKSEGPHENPAKTVSAQSQPAFWPSNISEAKNEGHRCVIHKDQPA